MHAAGHSTDWRYPSPLLRALIVAAVAAMGPAGVAWGGQISEIFLAEGGSDTGFADAVELAGLEPGRAHELVIVDAALGQPLVLSTHTLEPWDSTLLLKAGWSDDPALWWAQGRASARVVDASLSLAGPRSVLLFDGATGLTPLMDAGLAESQLLDAVTLSGSQGSASAEPFAGEQVVAMESGWAAVRPRDASGVGLGDAWYAGLPSEDGMLDAGGKAVELTPGWENPTIPEPTSLAAVGAGAALLWGRRRRVS